MWQLVARGNIQQSYIPQHLLFRPMLFVWAMQLLLVHLHIFTCVGVDRLICGITDIHGVVGYSWYLVIFIAFKNTFFNSFLTGTRQLTVVIRESSYI